MSRALKGGYYLVLIMESGASTALACDAMQRASEHFNREIP
jgi:hypothetical protein